MSIRPEQQLQMAKMDPSHSRKYSTAFYFIYVTIDFCGTVLFLQPTWYLFSYLNIFTILPPDWVGGCSEGLDAFIFFFKQGKKQKSGNNPK